MSRRSIKLAPQAVDLENFLIEHPDSSRWEVEAMLASKYGDDASYFHAVVGYVRNKRGKEVLVVSYDSERREYVYRVADSDIEGFGYIEHRTVKVRNEVTNLKALAHLTRTKFGSTDERYQKVTMLLSLAADMLELDPASV